MKYVVINHTGGTAMAKRKQSARKRKWEVLVSVEGDEIYVGIDVHKKSYHVAVWKNGKLVAYWVMAPHNEELVDKLLVAGTALKKAVYEAGPTGYALARQMRVSPTAGLK